MPYHRIKFICILLVIGYLSASGQPLLQSWRKVESRFIERNSVASEVNAFGLSNNLISKEDAANVQRFIDSLNNSLKHRKQLNRNYLGRIAGLNRKIEQMVGTYYPITESEPPSNSGNALRLFALYNRAKDELYSSIEEHNKQAISIKRKDLVFRL